MRTNQHPADPLTNQNLVDQPTEPTYRNGISRQETPSVQKNLLSKYSTIYYIIGSSCALYYWQISCFYTLTVPYHSCFIMEFFFYYLLYLEYFYITDMIIFVSYAWHHVGIKHKFFFLFYIIQYSMYICNYITVNEILCFLFSLSVFVKFI